LEVTEGGILAFVQPDTNLPKKLTPMEHSGSGNAELVALKNGSFGIAVAMSALAF
jgi:hypothetical protein